ncbi:uncharacterized protein LOC122093452 isoform X2 [Macadamia integrifolia]|nr:uncharacterized protein LOC122093452 isoform X2 [Macadamia integrifolia]
MASDTVEVASSENTAGIIDAVPPITSGNSISIQDSDIQSHNLASALISGSLFDVDEESFPSSVQEIHEIFPTKDVDTHQGVNEIETGPSPPLVADDAAANNIASQNEPLPDNQTSTTSLPPLDDADDVIEASELHSGSAGLSFHAPNERDSVDASSETSTYGGVEGHCQISNDLLMLCEDKHEKKISSGQTVGGSLPLPSKEIFCGSDCDDDCDDHEEDLSVISEDAVVSQSHLASHNVTGDGEPHTSSSHHSGS